MTLIKNIFDNALIKNIYDNSLARSGVSHWIPPH